MDSHGSGLLSVPAPPAPAGDTAAWPLEHDHLIPPGCPNNIAQTGADNQQRCLRSDLEAEGPRPRCWQGWALGLHVVASSLRRPHVADALWGVFYEAADPNCPDSTPGPDPRPMARLLMPLLCKGGVNTRT